MLSLYGTEKDCLVEHPKILDVSLITKSVWIDLVDPSADEEKAVEAALGMHGNVNLGSRLRRIEALADLMRSTDGTNLLAGYKREIGRAHV